MLEGEMRAARSVQQVIIPEAIPLVPNFALESIYKPAGEVGGDFFQILPTASGGVLIAIGDVSGKGMPAAMTVSLLVGTCARWLTTRKAPARFLAAMNQRMMAAQQRRLYHLPGSAGGPDGSLTVANAGHLAPHLNGEELPLENGLPLGLSAEAAYPESTFQLGPGQRLTLLTDGVVEARDAKGELSASTAWPP